MGTDKLRYFVTKNGWYYWRTTPRMKRAGFQDRALGKNEVQARQEAIRLNAGWDEHRFGERSRPGIMVYPTGSFGEAYNRAMRLREEERKAREIVWTSEQTSRDDWPRAWRWLGPTFGDFDPTAIVAEDLYELRKKVVKRVSPSEAHRVIKVWRALWKRMGAMGYGVHADHDPSLAFSNTAPDPRQDVWPHSDVLRLVQRAWRERYYGLAAVIAVAWDTMLSPVDVRKLTLGQRRSDEQGDVFSLDRAKTGRAAAGTLTRWSGAILAAYLRTLDATLLDTTPMFWSRGGVTGPKGGRPWPPRPYTKDRLSEDFRTILVRAARRAATPGHAPQRRGRSRRRRYDRHRSVQQDGEHVVGVEQIAEDLQPGEPRQRAAGRCRA